MDLRMFGFSRNLKLTNENESHRNQEGEDISADRLVVFAVSFGKKVQSFIDVIFAQCLWRKM